MDINEKYREIGDDGITIKNFLTGYEFGVYDKISFFVVLLL
jgi:hypothetical protein